MYFHVQSAEDKIRYPIVITATVIIVMTVDMRLLLFLLSLANEFSFSPPLPPTPSFQERFSCVSSCPILFWHFCQGALWRGEEGKGCRGWPQAWAGLLATDCPAAAATSLSHPPLHSRPPLISSLERFAAAALDRPLEKLIAVDSQQIEPRRLVSWPHLEHLHYSF